MEHKRISFAGSGKVASAFCKEFFKSGHKIELIVSESEDSSRSLSGLFNASWSTDLVFPATTEIIIVAVPDHKLKGVLSELKCSKHTIVVHTAGSYGLEVFPDYLKHKGVFYPLQTFSAGRDVGFHDLPFLLEASDKLSSQILKELAESLGSVTYFVDSEQRRFLHLAAVFICNFTNFMLTQGELVAQKTGYSLDLFIPLLEETVSKALKIGPEVSQTGPAIRNDINTIEKHLNLLSFSPELQKLYKEVTQAIIGYYHGKF